MTTSSIHPIERIYTTFLAVAYYCCNKKVMGRQYKEFDNSWLGMKQLNGLKLRK